jgi:hypothetical protein
MSRDLTKHTGNPLVPGGPGADGITSVDLVYGPPMVPHIGNLELLH